MKKNLTHLKKEELLQELVNLGEKPFRAKQIYHAIYVRGMTSFAQMTDISKDTKAKL